MKLEFEPNAPAVEYVENDSPNKTEPSKNLNEASKMFEAGVRLAQEGRSAEARNLLLRATEAEPENESAWMWLASISEYPEELLVFLNSVLKINPDNERALEWVKATKSLLSKTFVQRGIDASKENHKDFAKQCFLQAIVHDNQNEMAWLWLASVSNSEEEKSAYLQKVLEINPDNETALFSVKSLKNQRVETILQTAVRAAVADDYESAVEALEEIPESEDAWVLKAYLVNSFDEKLNCYEKVLELNPENEMAQANLIALLSLMEKAEANEKVSVVEEVAEPEKVATETTEAANEETFDLGVAEKEEDSGAANEEAFSFVQNQAEEEVSPEELPTQKLEFPEHFSLPESFSVNDEVEDSAEPELSFDAAEAEEILFDAGEVNDIPADEQYDETEIFDNQNSDFADFPTGEDEEFEDSQEESVQSYSVSPMESDFPMAEMASGMGEDEPVEEARLENSDLHLAAANDFEYNDDEPVNSEGNLPDVYEEEDAPNVYEIETDELFPPEVMLEDNYAQDFAEAEQNSLEEDFLELEEAASQPTEEFTTEQVDLDHDENAKSQIQVECPFCRGENEAQAFVCHSCRAALSLSDLEVFFAQRETDREAIGNALKMIGEDRDGRDFTAEELKFLGVGYLNLRNHRKGLNCLKQAVKINPDDIVLSSQVNALAIRLAEIERQESIHNSMPQNRTILIVDDSATVRKLVSGKLEKSGHEVICAVDGVDALEKLQETVPDLILLDINMPRMDGYQVCKLIRTNESTKDVPVVMISGKDGFFDKVRGRMAGTTGYITKPFGPETLMKTVETYVVQPVE